MTPEIVGESAAEGKLVGISQAEQRQQKVLDAG